MYICKLIYNNIEIYTSIQVFATNHWLYYTPRLKRQSAGSWDWLNREWVSRGLASFFLAVKEWETSPRCAPLTSEKEVELNWLWPASQDLSMGPEWFPDSFCPLPRVSLSQA